MSESTNFRPQPPTMKNPDVNEVDLWYAGDEVEDDGPQPEQYEDDLEASNDAPNWSRRAKDAFRFSTTFIDSNYRKSWEDSIRAFNNQHPGDSKYNAEIFRKRSNIFVPKTRSIIKKNEAAAAAAFFSNLDRISVTAANQNDATERVSAEIMESLLQYRLTKSIPWFQIAMGAIQDSQVQGACVSHQYWRYSMRRNGKGKLIKSMDKPAIDLIPIENFRFDPSASWTDPVNSSPYLIHVIPMYAIDVKARMLRPDPKGRQWKSYPDSALVQRDADDSTRRVRTGNQQDPAGERRAISDYDIVWIHRHIHRWNGTDYEFYTLASERMLTDPEPLENTVFHGQRPYVFGVSSIETHKSMPTPLPQIVRGLQDEINEIKNSRLDNVKFVLNKGFFAKRGKNVDLPALVRNVPGRVVLMDDPATDVVENNWPDVTSSSYLEEDRNNASFDELVGNFSAASVQTARSPREPARALTLLQAPATVLTEYLLKTFSETWVGPVLRQLVLLEQHYETDQVVLELAGKKSKSFQKFGMDKITDDLLERELSVNVNVGMGSTDPVTKLQKFLVGVESFTKICVRPPPGVNLEEIWKEIMALSGYQDGERFSIGQNPELIKQSQQIKMLTEKLQQLMRERKDKHEANVVKLLSARVKEEGATKRQGMKQEHESRHVYADHLMGMQDKAVEHILQGEQAESGMQRDMQMQAIQNQADQLTATPQPTKTPSPEPQGSPAQAMGAPPMGMPMQPPHAPLQPPTPPRDDKTDAIIAELVNAMTYLSKVVAETLKESVKPPPEVAAPQPRRRKGRATLPSGGVMEFEMADE